MGSLRNFGMYNSHGEASPEERYGGHPGNISYSVERERERERERETWSTQRECLHQRDP
jgi:hypothetical protein